MSLRELFGGAFTISIPSRFLDVSDFRPIPNHQEVFSDEESDQSLIVEINDWLDMPSEEASIHLFKTALEGANVEKMDSGVFSDLYCPQADQIRYVDGIVSVAKYREDVHNTLRVFALHLRLPSVRAEIFIITHLPLAIHKDSSSGLAVPNINHEWLMTSLQSFCIQSLDIFPPVDPSEIPLLQ